MFSSSTSYFSSLAIWFRRLRSWNSLPPPVTIRYLPPSMPVMVSSAYTFPVEVSMWPSPVLPSLGTNPATALSRNLRASGPVRRNFPNGDRSATPTFWVRMLYSLSWSNCQLAFINEGLYSGFSLLVHTTAVPPTQR